jgi:DNA-binding response OmpR family regulator
MTEKCRVLIVEDDWDTVGLIRHVLQQGGYEPLIAQGGKEGLQMLRNSGADLVLLDLMMEDMSGWTVLETIRADDRLCNVPVVIVSARHQLEERPKIREHEGMFEGYLEKPFAVQDLLAKVTEVLPSS